MRFHFLASLAGALSLVAVPVSAIDLPTMKAGLWEQTIKAASTPQKPYSAKMCIDDATQKEMIDMGMGTMKSMCSKNDVRRDGNKVYGSAECKMGESTMKSTSVTTFTGDIAYRSENKATIDPPMAGRASDTTVIEAKWVGSCPAGMQPGDVLLPDGQKVNMRAMKGGAK